MISELSDEEILDFLMNNDIYGDYSPEELKYLMTKWKYFYRVLYGKFGRIKEDSMSQKKSDEDQISSLKISISDLQIKVADAENKINSMKKRNLSWKERIFGKIIDSNENTGL
jgi:hypothetical protein